MHTGIAGVESAGFVKADAGAGVIAAGAIPDKAHLIPQAEAHALVEQVHLAAADSHRHLGIHGEAQHGFAIDRGGVHAVQDEIRPVGQAQAAQQDAHIGGSILPGFRLNRQGQQHGTQKQTNQLYKAFLHLLRTSLGGLRPN